MAEIGPPASIPQRPLRRRLDDTSSVLRPPKHNHETADKALIEVGRRYGGTHPHKIVGVSWGAGGTMLIVKTGTAKTALADIDSDFEDWIARGLGMPVQVCSVYEGEELPAPNDTDGAIVTGSSAMVSHGEAWAERTAAWLRDAVESNLPVLGICFGHQLLADALGGRVGPNPNGREIGTVRVALTDGAAADPLLGGLPERIDVHATHVESVLELPPGAELLAASKLDPHQAFRVPGRPVWGVQFHPEFSACIVRGYIEARRDDLVEEGADPDRLLAQVRETPSGDTILARFASVITGD